MIYKGEVVSCDAEKNRDMEIWKSSLSVYEKCLAVIAHRKRFSEPDRVPGVIEFSNRLVTKRKEKKHACDVCNKRFSEKFLLRQHATVHTGEKPHICSICKSGFTQKSSLQRHLFIHTGEKPYSCDFCEMKFPFKQRLKSHLRAHTGEKPFTCDVCQKGFSQRQCLTRHVLLQH